MNLVLIGFTSSGKSVTGELLAREMDLKFVDLDKMVEYAHFRKHGEVVTCRELYLKAGDEVFGAYERKVILEITSMQSDLVFSTGGKAPIRSGNADILGNWGTVIYLKTTPEVIYRRMKENGPPAYLEKGFSLDSVAEHWNARNPVYEEMADLVVFNDQLSVENTVGQILANLNFSGTAAQQ